MTHHANIRAVLANADHPVATLHLSGSIVDIGYDESDSDPTVYIRLPDIDQDHKVFMTPCEAHLFIAAVAAAQCQITGKAEIL